MSTADSPKTYRLSVPSVPDRVAEVDEFLESTLREAGVARVEGGVFGAHMMVEIHNDGPVTLIIDRD